MKQLFTYGYWLAIVGLLALSPGARAQCTLFQPARTVLIGGTTPASVVVVDINKDGKLDLVTANSNSSNVSVLLGNNNGSFDPAKVFKTDGYAFSVAVGDLNKDGMHDLVTANTFGDEISVLLGNNNGSFDSAKRFGVGRGPGSVAVGDFNGDGLPDLVTANSSSNNVSVLFGNQKGSFDPAKAFTVDRAPRSVVTIDLNGDGKSDLVTANFGTNTVSVLLADDKGSFNPAKNFEVGSNPLDVAVGDLNQDGLPDLVTADYLSDSVSVLLGIGKGSFDSATKFGVGDYPSSVAVGDLNGDTKPDLVATNSLDYSVSVLLGNDKGSFDPAKNFEVGKYPMSVAVGDFNQDGLPDLVTANLFSNDLSVLLNGLMPAPTLAAAPATTTAGQPITITASGCPVGALTWTARGGTGQVSGNTYTLTQPGNYTLSATCTLNGCTSSPSAPLALQIRPGGFAITEVSMVNCQLINPDRGEYRVQFTPQYAGQTSAPISFSVVNELATTTTPAPYSLRLYTDNPVITLVANQAGNGEARFAYNWRTSCQSGTSPNQPPTTTGIPAQTIVLGQAYQLQLTTYFTDPDGQAITFQATGLPVGLSLTGSAISGTPAQTGIANVQVTALDPGGLQVSTSFQLTVSPMPVTPPSGFAIVGVSTVQCQMSGAGERQLTFTPQYAGVSGEPISFSVVNEQRPTTAPGPYTLRLYTDNPAITLSAQQGSSVSTYRYNWLAVCNPAGRVGLGEAESTLLIRVLGNPLTGGMVEVQVQGAEGQPVQVRLTDVQGQLVSERIIQQAGPVESLSLPVAFQPAGLLILRVSTSTQSQTLKVLKR